MFARSGKGNFSYTSARVKAKKSKLLKEEDYNKLLMMSVPEMSQYISEAGYSKEMADYAGRYSGLTLLEYATYANMSKAFRSILKSSTGELSNMVDAYLAKWDFENFKSILRGKKYGLSADQIREDMVPAGNLSAEDLEKLIAANTPEDALAQFAKKTNITVPDDAVTALKENNNLQPIEDAMVKSYYRKLLASISKQDRPTDIFRTYIKDCIDIKNVETVMKFKADRISGDTVAQFWIPGGAEIDEKVMAQIAAAPDVKSALNEMQNLRMYADIKDELSDDSSILDVVAAMARYKAKLANKVGHMYPLSVIPVVDYMIHKENEVRNIRMIAHGTDSGLDRETMKGLLVI
ncbi:ATP synthase subunit C [Candidatus Methanomethylophilus sp. 1R26]|jgi:V/A-type H+-transporting ATPase subunit C|uniref:ATP synthase A1 subunit C n=1 Tax=Candidatus Methanomethylophilus sp. 1R26 TaxID=1769296 RepID=UPI0007366DC1|nr:ATP synthase A1 subunit C [Candidatus Methanomethylophilus sp. 1R26]MCH3978421.1 ATP synthase A1 subunit C [Methanomethylophilus sp.]TQS80866.1 MAG: V-type ATP synthase subunit C [Methanomethylophilus alvi]KUE73425.1 ATP synthase subunit C [Candidatus Methanomethylophilus sp. 1R26]MCI2074832.1 ATP synthase A1 subunit C [Methanomethylophilus sp.]MCI2093520.1 ATP synthase A1 subunit C [Methanomethylophilus sp.]